MVPRGGIGNRWRDHIARISSLRKFTGVSLDAQFAQDRRAQLLHGRAGQLAGMRERHLKTRLDPGRSYRQHDDPVGDVDGFLQSYYTALRERFERGLMNKVKI